MTPLWKRILAFSPLVALAALVVLFGSRLDGRNPNEVPSIWTGKPLPTITLPALDGVMWQGKPTPALATERLKGEVWLLNVFASWCAPCHQEHPYLLALSKEGVSLAGWNYKDTATGARRFLNEKDNPYRTLGVDASGRAAMEIGVYGVPETFVLNEQGHVIKRITGPLTPERIEKDIRPLMKK